MKISIEKQELLKHLKTSVGLLESLNTNPTMDCLLIEAKDKQLTIISSNNFSSLKNTTNKLTISTPGKVLVRGKIIYSIISKLKEKQINIELIDNKILRISTESFSSDINTEESSTYPSINFNFENWTKFTISNSFLNIISNKISTCVNPLEQNPTLSGLLIDSTRQPGMIETTGTDGFHLCYAKEKYDGEKFKIIVNINTLKQLNSLISENGTKNPVFFYLQNNQLITQVDNSMMLCRLLEGNYPSAMKTIEGTNPFKLTIDKTEILNGVERGMVLASGDKKPSIAMNIQPNKIKLVCRSAEYGTSYEEINITSNLKEPTTISLNAKLLLDLIKNIDSEKIIFEFTANNKPILIKNENNTNYVSLILPIRNI